MQRKYDVVLRPDETPEQVRDMLEEKFGVVAAISPEQFNSAHTLIVEGTIKQLAAVTDWYNSPPTDPETLEMRQLGSPPPLH